MATFASITPTAKLRADAAKSYNRMRAAGMPAGVTSAYRSREEQTRLYNGWIKRLPGYNQAAKPGTSNHEFGTALDLPIAPRLWIAKHGAKYGWTVNPRESWHYNYSPARDAVRTAILARRATAKARVAQVRKTLGILGWRATKSKRVAAQQLLKKLGYYHGAIDGNYGPLNKAAWAALIKASK